MEQDVFTQQNCELCIFAYISTTGNESFVDHWKYFNEAFLTFKVEKYNSKTFSSSLDHAILTEAFINLT